MNFGEVFNMKKRIPQILILIQSLMFLSCEMDPAYSTKPDSYYFNKKVFAIYIFCDTM